MKNAKIYEITYRPTADKYHPALPFSLRSVGHYQLVDNYYEHQKARDFVEFFYCVQGEGTCIINGTKFEIKAGDAFYYLPYEVQHLESNDFWEYRWFTFDGAYAKNLMQSFNYPRGPLPFKNYNESLFEQLAEGIGTINQIKICQLASIVLNILTCLGCPDTTPHGEVDIAERFFTFVKDNYSSNININSISSTLGIHRSTLNIIIKKRIGKTPGEYLYDFRIKQACMMLKATSLKCIEIATKCGFDSPIYFSQVIQKNLGCSPTEYRLQHRNSNNNHSYSIKN